ncbi:Hypothetical protein PMT_2624 [Prochlorococcus marinus str. MIT 9313]|uniref:Uncharacterized protein n=1 Tax=Prochlorococcus marinus (strain MIT 9313) TaxID=74547 RepID=B9ES11_PROMM|nr:Hypothetical protein PMT_2624 [Prochlorococcus marinus str. MIT 9313]
MFAASSLETSPALSSSVSRVDNSRTIAYLQPRGEAMTHSIEPKQKLSISWISWLS